MGTKRIDEKYDKVYFIISISCRYLASGMTFTDLEFDFHVTRKIILFIVKESVYGNLGSVIAKKNTTPQ
jgi:uncharacterized protein YbgA (DUF1722 family)